MKTTKFNFIENQSKAVMDLSLEAIDFYIENRKEDEMKKVDEYIYMELLTPHGYPYGYKFNIEKTENWLRNEKNINSKFIEKFKDNLSVMAFLNMNNIAKAANGLVW